MKNYICKAFPSLLALKQRIQTEAISAEGVDARPSLVIMECGCGTGSVVLPLMRYLGGIEDAGYSAEGMATPTSSDLTAPPPAETLEDADLTQNGLRVDADSTKPLLQPMHYVCFDISATAVKLLARHDDCKRFVSAGGKVTTFVHDIAADGNSVPLPDGCPAIADKIFLIFVLCAVPVPKMGHALQKLRQHLKPGTGELLFRDYAVFDHNHARFAEHRNEVVEGSYVKGDGTHQYFFEKDATAQLFQRAGFEVVSLEYHCNRVENRSNRKVMNKIFLNGVFRLKE